MERIDSSFNTNATTAKVNWSLVWLFSWTTIGVLFLANALGSLNLLHTPLPTIPVAKKDPHLKTTQAVAATITTQQFGWTTKNIEVIRVGDRVLADNPDIDSSAKTHVDPSTWRHIKLQAETCWDDGTVDDIHVETLQPPEWVKLHQAHVGALVPLPVDLTEMGLSEGIKAKVIANKPCPPIRAGPGRVVLTTVNHLNNDLRELTVSDGLGNRQTIRPTGLHKFYRERDGQWVSAEDLRPGTRIRGRDGPLTVLVNKCVPGVHRVYNMTVESEHVYHVSTLGVLAHNNGCAFTAPGSSNPLVAPPGATRLTQFADGSFAWVDDAGNIVRHARANVPNRVLPQVPIQSTDDVQQALRTGGYTGNTNWAYSIHDHHIYPKWLGGIEDGPLLRVRGFEHITDLEPALFQHLQRAIPGLTERTAANVQRLIRNGVVTQERITRELLRFYRGRYPQLSENDILAILRRGLE